MGKRRRVAEQSSTAATTTTTTTAKNPDRPSPRASSLQFGQQVQIKCLPGLEDVLWDELHDKPLGLGQHHVPSKTKGSVWLTNLTASQIMDCHLHLGSASHIWVLVTKFKCRALGELHRKVSKMNWKDWILAPHDESSTNSPVSVVATCDKSRLIHSKAVSERVHRGIHEALKIPVPESLPRPPTEDATTSVKIIVKVYHDEVTLFLDTSATPLHKRGYRGETGKAPLREDIAFAMLYAAGWKPTVVVRNNDDDADENENGSDTTVRNPYDAFLDPFCGSGTIAIEAAAMKSGLPPGRLRPPPLLGTPFFKASMWKRALQLGLGKEKAGDQQHVSIFASDRDEGAIRITRANAARAGLDAVIVAEPAAFSGTPWFDDSSKIPGTLLIASNLPFGRRVVFSKGPQHFYQKLLHHIHSIFRDRPTTLSAAMLLTSEPTAIQRCGGKPNLTPRLKTLHGGMSVTGLFTSSSSSTSNKQK
eukprot:scaffold6562_cov163-Amphora_coffeaeformis.AAC.8